MQTTFPLQKSLNELEVFPSQNLQNLDSGLIQRCERVMDKKLLELTPEDIRLLVSQSIGLTYTVPLALDFLEEHPFISGRLFIGDLLLAVMKVSTEFWEQDTELYNRMVDVVSEVEIVYSTIQEDVLPLLQNFQKYSCETK